MRDGSVRFLQTVGGRAGFPAPRRVRGKPFFRIHSATAWTTLALTIHADGSYEYELAAASPFPRHWVYDDSGKLVHKAGTIDFKKWYREAHGEQTPWGGEDSAAVVTAAEGELERRLAAELMRAGERPERRLLSQGETLVEQGDPGDELYLLLDGVLTVEVDGKEVGEIGPGAILGERALVEGGTRTATLRASTRSRIAVFPGDAIDRSALDQLATGRRAAGCKARGQAGQTRRPATALAPVSPSCWTAERARRPAQTRALKRANEPLVSSRCSGNSRSSTRSRVSRSSARLLKMRSRL